MVVCYLLRSFCALTLLCFLSAVVYAQQATGTITGTITDPHGAIVQGAAVEVRNVATNAASEVKTNESGFYNAQNLPVGEYTVGASAVGFKKAVRTGIQLQVAQNAQINIALEVGQLAETIQVQAEAPLVDTGGATLGSVIENRRVRDLPLNGRNALALTLLNSGVISNAGPTNSGFGDRGVQISSLSINGSPSSMNAQMLDGNNNVLSYVGEVGVPPAVDAVEEFKVQSGTMSAEYGFTAGGSINLVTKSGTNQFHGTLYEFLRNDKLDARNTFAARKLPLRYNQFGGSIGGPIIKDRTFGFANWEEYKLRQATPRIATVPIAAWRQGDFSNFRTAQGQLIPIYDPQTTAANPNGQGQIRQQFPGNMIPASRFDPITRKILDFWPQPNKTPINEFTQSQNFEDQSLNRTNWDQGNFRVDHRFTDRNTFFFRYTHAHHQTAGNSIFTDPTVGQDRADDQINRNIMMSDTHTFSPTLLSNLRIGAMRQKFDFHAVNAGQDWPSKLGLPSTVPNDQFPQIDFGFSTIGGQAYGTRGSLNWDIQETLTWIVGSHTVKFGYNHRILQGSNQQGAALSGNYTFTGLTTNPQLPAGTGSNLAQFLLGEVGSASIDRILGNSWQGIAASGFVQDDWRVSRRLTLNLGLRYDYQQKPYERNNGQINFDPTARIPGTPFVGATVFAGKDGQPRTFLDEDYNDWGPRIGFALDVFGTGKTVFRGGYGIFYPSIFFRTFLGNTQLFTTTNTQYVAAQPGFAAFKFSQGFPRPYIESPGASAGPGALLGQGVSITESDSSTPLTQQWNASLQQQVGSWMFDVTYAANKGNHFAANSYDLNQVDPAVRLQLGQALNTPVPNPYAGLVPGGLGAATITRERSLMPFPYYSTVMVRNPRLGNYMSHQLQINVTKRMSNGLLVNLAFTGGKKISDSTLVPVDFGTAVPLEQVTENAYQDGLYNRQLNKSVDPGDVSKRLVISALYELPFGPGKALNPSNGFLQRLVGGWQLNTIGVLQTGIPLIVRGASNNAANRPSSTGESAKLDNPTRSRWFNTDVFVNPPEFTLGNVGRTLPDVRTPGTVNFDLSMIKDTRITERINLQFRAESFNFMNHVNLYGPNVTFSPGANGKNASANFGTINTARDARINQLGLKLIF
jgi:hypothetical protein